MPHLQVVDGRRVKRSDLVEDLCLQTVPLHVGRRAAAPAARKVRQPFLQKKEGEHKLEVFEGIERRHVGRRAAAPAAAAPAAAAPAARKVRQPLLRMRMEKPVLGLISEKG